MPSAKNAAITGWGKCLPPAVLSNADLATFLDTTDEWILTRTGIRERRVSHVPLGELAYVAAARALACAGVQGKDIELIVFGTTSYDDQVPNVASGIQRRIGADGCAAMDVNTACTSFLYSLSTATALIRTGVVQQCAGHRRRDHLAVHGLERSQCRGAVRRRRRRGGARGHRPRRRLVSRTAGLLRRVARDPARAWHGRGLRAPGPHPRPDRMAVRRPGDLQEGRAWHEHGLRRRR